MAIHYKEGDSIRGYKIIARARKFNGPRLIHGSHSHKASEFDLIDNAYCVIDREVKTYTDSQRKKDE